MKVCVAGDKYDCIEIVRPWLSKWIELLRPLADQPGHEEFLFIAWTVGDEPIFRDVARRLALESSTNAHNQCLTAPGKILGGNLPPGIIGQYYITSFIHDLLKADMIREMLESIQDARSKTL